MNRIRHNLNLFDTVRLDHFRGFEGFWEVPSTHRTAEKGSWVEGPGEDFFDALGHHFPSLPFIAEDLGEITPEVLELRDKYGLPGMRVLQFAFSEDPSSDIHKPHNYSVNCVAFTGTHDNNTLTGWLCEKHGSSAGSNTRIAAERKRALEYIGKKCARAKRVHWEFIRIVMMSVASVVVFPMQDVVGLGKNARMNHPGKPYGNWEWRLLSKKLTNALSVHLREMSELYGRC
jgi:4-alpha-glucanotransferase